MFEIYLFVNPLDTKCMQCELDAVKFSKHLNGRVRMQFVPFINMQTITKSVEMMNRNPLDLETRNWVSAVLMSLALDFKAACFQGRRKGRRFLFKMQTAILEHHQHYSNALVQSIATEVGLDFDMFMEDRSSELSHKAFASDQNMAIEFGVRHSGTAVVYNATIDHDGVLLNDFNYDALEEVCSHDLDTADHTVAKLRDQAVSNLHVL